jgi:outer membrane receptor protein involved in Fe transport
VARLFAEQQFEAAGRTKYSVTDGSLSGFSVNVGVTHISETPSEAPNAGDPAAGANGVQAPTSTNQWKLRIPAFTLWNVGMRYKVQGTGKFSHTLNLNINNVFDRDYLKVNKNQGDGRGIYFSYTLGFSRN